MTIKDKRNEYPSSPAMPATTNTTLQEMEAMMESVQAQVESVRAQMESVRARMESVQTHLVSIEDVQAKLEVMIDTEKSLNSNSNLNLQREKKVQQGKRITFAERMTSINIIVDCTDDGREDQVTGNANGRRYIFKDNGSKDNGEDYNSDAEAGPVTSNNNNHSHENDIRTGQTAENENNNENNNENENDNASASDGTTTSSTTSSTTTALELSDEDVKQMLFVESTHRLLFLDTIRDPSGRGLDYKVGCWDRFLAIGIIAFQCGAYVILALNVMGETLQNGYASDFRPLEIQTKYCHDPNDVYDLWTTFYTNLSEAVDLNSSNLLASLKCEEHREPDPIFGDTADGWTADGWKARLVFWIVYIMLWAFLLPDLFEGFVLFKCRGWAGKMVSMLVSLELSLATYAAFTAFIGYGGGAFGFLDTILFVVGIVFVHDLDEKFEHWRGILRQLKQSYRCLEFQFWTVSLVIFFINHRCSRFSMIPLYAWLEERA